MKCIRGCSAPCQAFQTEAMTETPQFEQVVAGPQSRVWSDCVCLCEPSIVFQCVHACVCVYFQDRLPLRDLIRHLVFKCVCWCILQWFPPGNRPVCMCARKEMNSSNYNHPYYNHTNILFIRSLFYLLSPFFSSSHVLNLSIFITLSPPLFYSPSPFLPCCLHMTNGQ